MFEEKQLLVLALRKTGSSWTSCMICVHIQELSGVVMSALSRRSPSGYSCDAR